MSYKSSYRDVSVPERYWRFPTRRAVDSLSARFRLRNEPGMQDWEYEVADSSRIGEFLSVLESDELDDDERFTLAETVMQSFEDLAVDGGTLAGSGEWHRFTELLSQRPELHAHTLCYWSCIEDDVVDAFAVTPLVRIVWAEAEARILDAR